MPWWSELCGGQWPPRGPQGRYAAPKGHEGVAGRVGLWAPGEGLEAQQPASAGGRVGCPAGVPPGLHARECLWALQPFPQSGPSDSCFHPDFIHKTHE